jgi:hypothetical protein
MSEENSEFTKEELAEMEQRYNDFIAGSGNFDIDRLVAFAKKMIAEFAEENADLVFYGFAIDADLLCFNSVVHFEKELSESKKRYPQSYSSPEDVLNSKWNPGNWEFQGFAYFDPDDGFSAEAYEAHYDYVMGIVQDAMEVEGFKGFGPLDIPEGAQLSDYARTMNEVIRRLIAEKAFNCLKTTQDFRAVRVEHSY